LIFAINFTTEGFPDQGTLAGDYDYTSLTIYIPPEFSPPGDMWASYDTSNIVTTIGNDYGYIYVWKADVKDPFGPNWWVIYIWSPLAGNYWDYAGKGIRFTEENDYKEWYYVRVNGMTAPKIAGKYTFKMFLDDSYPIMNVVNANGDFDPNIDGDIYPSTMPAENWPVLLVKGEIDPGIIEGTVRYGAWNTDLYNDPIQLPGRVRAVGVANDPYTGASTGRLVEARGYFNASAKGHYEVEGVAPGVYDIYASAAGYPEVKVASGITILPGKSLHLDVLLNPGPIITGVIYSKHSFGEIPFPSKRPVTVEIYDSNEWPADELGYGWGLHASTADYMAFERGTSEVWTDAGYQIVDAHLKSFSPINLTDSPFTSYVIGNVIYTASGTELLAPNVQKLVAFPWEGPTGLPAVSWTNSPAVALKDNNGLFNGVGPAQDWWVETGTMSFRFQFGIKGFYGAPMDFDGHVPQVYATWINGLTAGTYYLRSWINGYVQTDISGNYVDYPFSVAAEEWAGDINTPMDLETSSWINKTVHFHDLPGTLATQPIRGPDRGRYLIAEAFDANNVLVAMNFTWVPATASSASITLNGFGMIGPQPNTLGTPAGMKFFLYRYRHIRDYGIMPGTYTIRVYMRGYVQQEFELASISLSSSPAYISNHMYRGAGINMTIYSIDWEHPRIDRNWLYPGDPIRVYVYDSEGNEMGYVRYWDGAWSSPTQWLNRKVIPNDEWSADYSKLKFNGTWALEAYGPDLEGWLSGYYYYDWATAKDYGEDGQEGKFDAQTGIFLEFGWDWYGFLVNPWRYRTDPPDLKTVVALETDTYELKAYTLGYVQKKAITVYAQKGQQADTKINLVQGVNITVNIKFKKEGIFTHVPYNTSFRIRVFNENDELVATWLSSLFDWSGYYYGVIHDGAKAYGGYGIGPDAVTTDPYPADIYVRDSTTELQVLLAGNFFYWEIDQEAQTGGINNADTNRVHRGYGIDGWPNYQGNWRIEVDAVNTYYSDKWFPAPPGLLLGESYHIINGVEGPYGGIFKYNHLGPWEQRMVITVPNAHLGAEASVVFELDLRGLVSGQVAGFTWSDELRPVSWASITASGAAGTFTHYSWDGYYDMYLPAGSYELTVEAWEAGAGYDSLTSPITVSTGQLVTGFSFYLERSNIPIPEFPVAIIGLASALAASLYILRRTRRKGN